MKVLVCGGRDYGDFHYLASILNEYEIDTIIHGNARGADSLAERYGQIHGIPIERYPANWKKHGKAAGPIRNKEMLLDSEPDLVIACPGGRGTQHMIDTATEYGYEVREI